MELRHFRYFLAVAEELNFHRAARRLHLAQPALSRQIQDLEEELGARLFDRLPRGVQLTKAGEAYVEHVRKILSDVDEANAHIKQVQQGEVGTLRIGFNDVASSDPSFAESIRRFRSRYPKVRIDLAPMTF